MENPKIKVLFICSSLEPEQDGVGDYTRRLAQALINRGHKACIIAINDRRMTEKTWQGKQNDNNTEIDVLRLSEKLPWKLRLKLAKKFTDAFNPDWISLQYVPFGYQIKGLPFNLDKKLKWIAEDKHWHVMFHELSVNKNDSFKFKIWAFLQIQIIKSLLRGLNPLLITTNTKIYQCRLEQLGYSTTLLPLFSNIQRTNSVEHPVFADMIPEDLYKERNDYVVATLFGSFPFKSWNIHSLLNKFLDGYKGKKFIVASIGKMSSGIEYWKLLQQQYPQIRFLTLGIRGEAFISHWLSEYTDFGILTTPPELASKSGSFMAFKEHGIPVVCTKENIELKHFKIPLDKVLTIINDDEDFVLPLKYEPVSVLDEVTEHFINNLESSQRSTVNSQ